MKRYTTAAHNLWLNLVGAWTITGDMRSFFRLATDFILARVLLFRPLRSAESRRSIQLNSDVTIHYRLNRGDIWAIYEIWIEQSYRLPEGQSPLSPGVFVDLGANIGLTALWYAKTYNCNKIIAVEAVPSNSELVKLNLESNGIEAHVIDAAVGRVDGEARLLVSDCSTNSRIEFDLSVDHTEDDNLVEVRSIDVRSMESILGVLSDDEKIAMVKVDIEGGEQELLSGDVNWLSRCRTVFAEFHHSLVDYPALTNILENAGLTPRSCVVTNETLRHTLEFFSRNKPSVA